jgi:hypothetical protein
VLTGCETENNIPLRVVVIVLEGPAIHLLTPNTASDERYVTTAWGLNKLILLFYSAGQPRAKLTHKINYLICFC